MTPRQYREGVTFRIRALAADAGLTQTEMAARLGLPRNQVNHWFHRRSAPAPWHMPEVARLLGCSTAFLMFGEEE